MHERDDSLDIELSDRGKIRSSLLHCFTVNLLIVSLLGLFCYKSWERSLFRVYKTRRKVFREVNVSNYTCFVSLSRREIIK